jgi:hypothetical protein
MKSGTRIVTTEAVLWEWLNALASTTTRAVAAESYRRVRADTRVEVVPFGAEINGAAVDLYRSRSDKEWSLTDLPVIRGHGTALPDGSTHGRSPL